MLGAGLIISGQIAWVDALNAFAVNKKEAFGSPFYFISQSRLLPATSAPTNHQECNGNDRGGYCGNNLGINNKSSLFSTLQNVNQQTYGIVSQH
jgi:hypothetical protein